MDLQKISHGLKQGHPILFLWSKLIVIPFGTCRLTMELNFDDRQTLKRVKTTSKNPAPENMSRHNPNFFFSVCLDTMIPYS